MSGVYTGNGQVNAYNLLYEGLDEKMYEEG